jgi:hypothetical protein
MLPMLVSYSGNILQGFPKWDRLWLFSLFHFGFARPTYDINRCYRTLVESLATRQNGVSQFHHRLPGSLWSMCPRWNMPYIT